MNKKKLKKTLSIRKKVVTLHAIYKEMSSLGDTRLCVDSPSPTGKTVRETQKTYRETCGHSTSAFHKMSWQRTHIIN